MLHAASIRACLLRLVLRELSMAQLQPSGLTRVFTESKIGGATSNAEPDTAHGVASSSARCVSVRISQHSTIAEDPASQTPRASRGSFPDVDIATLIEPDTTQPGPQSATPLYQAESAIPRTNFEQIARRRHKKSQSDYVGSFLRRRKDSDASTYRRSYIVESAHDLWSSVRHSTIQVEEATTRNRHRDPSTPRKIRRKQKDKQQMNIDDASSHMKDRLKEAVVHSGMGGNRRFIPRSVLDRIIDQKSVEFELTRWQYLPRKYWQAWRRPTAVTIEPKLGVDGQPIGKTYQLIFAILLALHRPSKIWSFIENGVSDTDLPLVKHSQGTRRFELRRKQEPRAPLKCFKRWTFDEIGSFAEQQWVFLAPCFERASGCEIPHVRLETEHVLPFSLWSPIQDGGYGEVYKAEIPPGHHSFGSCKSTPYAVAIKKLTPKKGEDIAREADVLRGLSGGSHPNDHLVSLLATFEYNGGFYLIFPLADADLQRFWKRSKTCTDPYTERWMLEQSFGIASALYKIHRYETFPRTSSLYKSAHTRKSTMAKQELASILEGNEGNPGRRLFGRHGDIKPNNILHFPNLNLADGLGTLKITDFGITQFSTEDKRLLKDGEKISCTSAYQSPECVLDRSISTACDIWALGCVYLEFVLWYLRGYQAVVAFSRARDRGYETDTFFNRIGQDELTGAPMAEIKPCVVQLIHDLRTDPSCTLPLRRLLDLIDIRMLVGTNSNTILTQRGSHHDDFPAYSNERISSGTLMKELGSILQDYGSLGPYEF
ncbi:hypothetical protein C7974DRAFT_193152 [Boeremia exigua]|uniref:uncharacterized protein n=1 Tax=Boeremia exigua TaxID=749465 RepID=UPI001E8D605C|nr:uncharacterized protein C7974DRAFT_193152 [Boeremia exigua]KAH6629799.1 hypothetical protein C7974DRAFT_193152 [Boeremia exigua]